MKIAIAQINPLIGDFEYNFNKIKSFIDNAIRLSCDLVVFSELVISGYPPRDLLEKNDFIDANLDYLNRLIKSTKGIGVICGFIDKNTKNQGKPLYNSAVLFENGDILHKVHKQLLPAYDVFDEGRYFEPGGESTICRYRDHRIGLTICEDAWNDPDIFEKRIYALNPVAGVVESGADLIINISASPFHAGVGEFRHHMFSSIARKYHVPVIFANQTGGNDSLVFDGLSTVFSPGGQMVARAGDFIEDMVVFDSTKPVFSKTSIHDISKSENESILKALITGTRDYVTKCGFFRVIVGLSGGIDSALTACIAAMALGPENVSAVFMPSRYTSPENFEDTTRLSDNLGIKMTIIPIDDMFKEFLKFLSPSFKESDIGVTEQNIQARIRGTILMGLSNQTGSLVLSTGNKSELAVGYCTLYGDMSGGLAVISDVPKTIVYKIARFINQEKSVIPPRILTKAPSAELKPDQTDQDDLPPYDLLDAILKGYIEEFKRPEELVRMGFDRKIIDDIIIRIDQNEYKRHQAAPGLKITSKAFGYGRRYPIAQGYRVTK